MLKDQREIIAAFNAHGVKYLVIGGHAVSIHAEPRGTKDLDLFIKADKENSEAVFAALAELGAPIGGMMQPTSTTSRLPYFKWGTSPVAWTSCRELPESPLMKRGKAALRNSSTARLRRTSSREST